MRLLPLVVAACGSSDPQPPAPVGQGSNDIVTGSVFVDGTPAALVACAAGHQVHTFVEVVTSAGKLRFEDQQLWWNPVAELGADRGAPQHCAKLDRSWGGGVRSNTTAYWRGTLMFDCDRLRGNLTLECGGITDEERKQLDKNRQDAYNRGAKPENP